MVTQLDKGDRVVVTTAGGGGYGLPAERDAGALRKDVLDDKVSLGATRDDYEVS
jgi:N-methylhydantoinase B/oxoprolinase/acetone carboxylase alpha subunit